MRDYYNWENKEERAKKAQEHTEEVEKLYKDSINESIKKSYIYRNSIPTIEHIGTNNITVIDKDSVSAAYDFDDKVCILNFASYKNPGGMFLKGSRAQEECLCHESTLYNVLKTFQTEYYDKNASDLNNGLYRNAAIYSRNILFNHNNKIKYCDVLTCAAPNKGAAQKYKNIKDDICSKELKSRIKFVVNVLSHFDFDTIILGAFGCGVFKQDPKEVATIFKEELKILGDKNIVFAIPDKTSENYKAFKQIFS